MGSPIRDLAGGNWYWLEYFVSEAITAGQALVLESTATDVGEVQDPTTTTAVDFVGCADTAVSFTATPTGEPAGVRTIGDSTPENLVRLPVNPFLIWEFLLSGGATAGTALATTAPANILTNTTLSAAGTTITAAEVGTANMAGGLVIGRTGANVGVIRKLNAHTDNTSTAVGIAFVRAIAVGDTFIRVPYSRHTLTMQLTTNFVQANGIIAVGTGAPFAAVGVRFKEDLDQAFVQVVARDHAYNPQT